MANENKETAVLAARCLFAYIQGKQANEVTDDIVLPFVDSLSDLYSGYEQQPDEIVTSSLMKNTGSQDMIVLKDIPFSSMCAHHLLPFIGKVHVGYIPNNSIAGLGSIVRMIESLASRLQIQENLTDEIAAVLFYSLQAQGTMVMLESKQACLSCRGAKKEHLFTTIGAKGAFHRNAKDSEIVRKECLSLFQKKGE